MLLVVGDVGDRGHSRAAGQLLAGTEERPTRRVVVAAAPAVPAVVDRLEQTGPIDGQHARVVSVGESGGEATAGGRPPVVAAGNTMGDIGETIAAEIDDLERSVGGFGPGDLRIGIETLEPMVETYDHSAVFQFLHLLGSQMRSVDGVAYAKLALPRDSDVVRTLRPVFDAVVELRDGGTLERRWVPAEDDATDWASIDTGERHVDAG